ncbi:MAG: TRAP transporter substrate-binding protein [Sneathiella sp.]|nr:TRAP transporter substrate-binding protein [Sneathiella sp.]
MKVPGLKILLMTVCPLWTLNAVQAEITLKYALAAPAKTPWTAHANELAASIAKSTNGTIKVNVFPGGQLGNEQDVIRQVVRGRVQMGSFSNTAASLVVPEIALLAAPYLWKDTAQADCVLDNHLTTFFEEKFAAKGLILLGWTEVGKMGYASTKDITGLKDLVGAKMRVAPTKASSITANSLGANSVVLPITEVASALQTGLVDGADLPGIAYTAMGFSKIAPTWFATNHSHQVGLVLMSAKVWKKFSAAEKEQILKAQLPADALRTKVRAVEKALLGKFVKDGGNLVTLSSDDMEKMQRLAKNTRLELVDALGGEAKATYQKIQQAKQACQG